MITWFANKCMALVAEVPQTDEEWEAAMEEYKRGCVELYDEEIA